MHRPSQPAQVDLAERLEPAGARGEAAGQAVGGDLPRCDLLLQARRDDHRRTGRERLVRASAGEHLAGRETDPHLEADAVSARDLLVEPCDGVAHVDRGTCRPQRVVLVGER